MADERTDVATIEEMSAVFCRWEEDGVPEEHFLEVVHLMQRQSSSSGMSEREATSSYVSPQ